MGVEVGLGANLCRAKVWSISSPNISPCLCSHSSAARCFASTLFSRARPFCYDCLELSVKTRQWYAEEAFLTSKSAGTDSGDKTRPRSVCIQSRAMVYFIFPNFSSLASPTTSKSLLSAKTVSHGDMQTLLLTQARHSELKDCYMFIYDEREPIFSFQRYRNLSATGNR